MSTVAQLPVESGASKVSAADAAFLQQIERNIALLNGQRFLRISLFRFQFVGGTAAQVGARARQALSTLGLVGLLPDGSLGLLYVAPRPSAYEDLVVERAVIDKVNRILATSAPSEARILSAVAAHRWTDEIADADALIDEVLFVSATQPCAPAALRKAS